MFKHLTNGFDGRLELSLASNKGPTHGVIARVISSDICHLQSIRKPEPLRVPIGTIIVLRCDRVILRILIPRTWRDVKVPEHTDEVLAILKGLKAER